MPRVRQGSYGSHKFYKGGIKLYPKDELYKEMSFISYYFHWPESEVSALDHVSRRRWCSEISEINKSLNPSNDRGKKEKSILDMLPG